MVLMQKQQEYLVEQQKLEERNRIEKEILEKERLTQFKNKNKDEESKSLNFFLLFYTSNKKDDLAVLRKNLFTKGGSEPTQSFTSFWLTHQTMKK